MPKAPAMYRKLYEALTHNRGVRLTADDVWKLIQQDEAVQTRFMNAAADEAGIDEPGDGWACDVDRLPRTWKGFVEKVKRDCS